MSKKKRLDEISWEEFIQIPIIEIDTWPYLPGGILEKPGKYTTDTKEITEKWFKELNEVEVFIERFSERRKTNISWILASFIGLIGNLAFNFAFAFPLIKDNMVYMTLLLLIVFALVILYFSYLPKLDIYFYFMPEENTFPKEKEQFILDSSYSTLYGEFYDIISKFGTLIRACILKDNLSNSLLNSPYINISKIEETSPYRPSYFIYVTTKGIKPWINPCSIEYIRKELREFTHALMETRTACNYMTFELDNEELRKRGPNFISTIINWDLDKMQKNVIEKLKTL